MLIFADTQDKFDHWKAKLFDQNESMSVEAATMLVEVANKSKELRQECISLIAARLEQLNKGDGDLFSMLKAVSDLSRGLISSNEALMLAIMKTPIKDSYALNMATGILLYEMDQGFIKPDHALKKQILDMATQVVNGCRGDARRNAMRILELAKSGPTRHPDFSEP
jgi:hypothetical protein